MKFMMSSREAASRQLAEAAQLRHRDAMQWVAPGYEDECLEADKAHEAAAKQAAEAAPPVRLHRRSYKGFNPYIEGTMKDIAKKHAEAKAAAEELAQASNLFSMKKRRVK